MKAKQGSQKSLRFNRLPSVALVYRWGHPQAVTLAQALAEWLAKKKVKVFTAPEQKRLPGTLLLKTSAQLGKMGLVVVLGGDGTYLRAVRLLAGKPVPILGVNLGSLGFLTPTRADEVFSAVEQALDQKMQLVPRSMLTVEIVRKGKSLKSTLALNDIVIERGTQSQLINIAIHSDDQLVSHVKADGLIVSSPTGSTAYNLAAGGPLLHPEVRAFAVTAIAPHSLTNRPLIVPDDRDLKFSIVSKATKGACGRLIVDGQAFGELHCDDLIVVRRNPDLHWMIRPHGFQDFALMREKLKFGDRT